MSRFAGLFWLLFLLATSLPAFTDDREKAEKQARKITAMATDKIGRRMVSMSLADSFQLPRPELVEERRRVGLNYGYLFVARELAAKGAAMSDIQSELKAGKTIWQIGDERNADWKQIAADAKRLNTRTEDYIYRHFLNRKNELADQQRDLNEKYSILYDAVVTDFSVTPKEMVDAQAVYIFWRDRASDSQGA
jgi:hypothetical protein